MGRGLRGGLWDATLELGDLRQRMRKVPKDMDGMSAVVCVFRKLIEMPSGVDRVRD